MSTYTSEPGTRLAGRYRLVDQVNAGAGWTLWKATDETLARSVTVLTFAAAFPRVTETVTAARAASRLNDPRFSQVFDVEDADEAAYVVMEWVVGESLLDMLAEGPLDPPRAAALVAEAARAMASAHAAGLTHLRLDPACLHWTAGGGVKITGLGMDAALTGPEFVAGDDQLIADDAPELTDTRDLGRLLYAALTGYWPGLPGSAPGLLPPAPETDGIPCTPRQVSAGVPAGIDAVTCQAVFQRPSRHGPPLTTPAEFADALALVAPPVPLPMLAPPASAARTSDLGYSAAGSTNPYPASGTAMRSHGGGNRRPPGERSTAIRAVISVVVVLVLAAVGVAVWSFSRHPQHAASPNPTGGAHPTGPAAVTSAGPLTPVSANSFDQTGSDDPGGARYAIDGNPSTAWHTDYYFGSPTFGNLKKGAGLILDMGKQVRLTQVVVQFGTNCCTHVELEIGDNPAPAALSTFTGLQNSTTAAGLTTFDVTSKTAGRYVLIWITDLPSAGNSKYESFIYNVTVHGSAVSQSG